MTRRERRAMEAALAAAGKPLNPPRGSLEPEAPELIDAAAPQAEAMYLPSRVDESAPVPVGSAPEAGVRHQRSLSSPPELIEPPREDPSATSFVELPLGDAPAEFPVPDSLSTLLPPSGSPIGTSPTQLPTIADLAPPRPEDAVAAPMPAPQLWSSPEPSGDPLPPLDPVPPLDWATLDRRTGSAEAVEAAQSVDLAQGAGSAGGAPVPVPHWSEQAAQEPEELPLTAEELGVSTGPITSTALVLPAIPEGADLSVPFTTSTGEVLVTGSMRLPVQYGTTGAVPRQYDHSELDALIEAADGDDAEGEAAPVRALKAVSTHTSPRDVIAMSRQKDSSRLPIVLAITAGVMMVSVTVLIVAGFMFGTF